MTNMPVGIFKTNIFVTALLFLVVGVQLILAFSDGRKLASGVTATRSIYCHRSGGKRQPFHFDKECNGYCEPHRNSHNFFTIDVPTSTYWLDAIYINISAIEGSGKSVTGFSIHALNEKGDVAGSFVEDEERGVVTGTCSDIITYSQETSGAFHRMANHSRKNVTLEWQPDGYNHGPVKFVAWVVNNHSDIFYIESHPLMCARNGSYSLDLQSVLQNVINDVDLDRFEKSFKYRSRMGYQLNLEDPFSPFENPPKEIEFVPLTTKHFRVQPKKIPVDLRGSTKSLKEQERRFSEMLAGGFDNLLGGVDTLVGGVNAGGKDSGNVVSGRNEAISSPKDNFVGGTKVTDKDGSKLNSNGDGAISSTKDGFVGGAMVNDKGNSEVISTGGEAGASPPDSSVGGANENQDNNNIVSGVNDAGPSTQDSFIGVADTNNGNDSNPVNSEDGMSSMTSDELEGGANLDNPNNLIDMSKDYQESISNSSNDTPTSSTVNATEDVTTKGPILLSKLVP